ncbi:unnamed protein product, partial [Rotaria magnacalcarata]
TNPINVDSDTTSTSSQTSSEHDPQVTSLVVQAQTYTASPTTNWSEERTSFFATNNLASSQQATTTSKSSSQASPSLNVPVNSLLSSPNNNLLTESTKN